MNGEMKKYVTNTLLKVESRNDLNIEKEINHDFLLKIDSYDLDFQLLSYDLISEGYKDEDIIYLLDILTLLESTKLSDEKINNIIEYIFLLEQQEYIYYQKSGIPFDFENLMNYYLKHLLDELNKETYREIFYDNYVGWLKDKEPWFKIKSDYQIGKLLFLFLTKTLKSYIIT